MTWPAASRVTPQFRRNRPLVWARDGGRCRWPLHSGFCDARGWQVDHVVPRFQGGSDDLANLRVLCKRHHDRKTAAEAAEAKRLGRRGRKRGS